MAESTLDIAGPGTEAASNLLIQVNSLEKSYKRGKVMALNEVSLAVKKGEVFGLIGPNGAGKTTLMQCLIGVIRPSKGTIAIDGYAPDHLKVKEQLAFLPERPAFDGWMTARQFLRYHYMLAKKPYRDWKKSVEAALDLVQLEEQARGRKITQFSRGMLQRVGLAQMIVGDPKICFLDEPTSGMDPIGMQLVRDLLIRWKSQGTTVILNSHHLDEVERVCDRVAFIAKGTIQSIETIGQALKAELRLCVKWQSSDNDSPEGEKLQFIAEALNVVLDSANHESAVFRLKQRAEKAAVVKALVDAGVAVEEVTTEKKNLVDLFLAHAQEAADQDGQIGDKR